jgi:sterol desaturase/sphingolipid hydroxylase (fatty acid hydroxylase superfamily)
MNIHLQPLDTFLLFVMLPATVSVSLLEAWVLSRRGGYDWRAAGISYADLALRLSINIGVPFAMSTPVTQWAHAHRLSDLQLDGWASGLLLFFGLEFCYYWFHRASHRVRWFWCNHAVHHSPNEPRMVGQALAINLLYQFWIHATWIPRLGWLEWVLNTPSAHRVHHGSNPEYLDANYGGVLIIFDRLFGTYVVERDDIAIRYGLVKPQLSHNPLRVWFSEWLYLWRDMRRAPSLSTALLYLVKPPAWRPAAPSTSSAEAASAAN